MIRGAYCGNHWCREIGGSGRLALNFCSRGTLNGKFLPKPLYSRDRTHLSTDKVAGWIPERLSTFQSRETSFYPAKIRTPHRPARCLVTLATTLSRLLWIQCNAFFILKKDKLSLPVVSETLRNALDSWSTYVSLSIRPSVYIHKNPQWIFK